MAGWRRIWLLGLFMMLPVTAMAGDYVGDIIAVDGMVTLRDDKARKTEAMVGMAVETGQLIKTAKDSTAQIRLADGAVVRIAARSTFILDEFLVDGTDTRTMTARMLTGAMQYVSRPARFGKDDRKIFLANASASIRGTDFIAFVDRRIEAVLVSGQVDLAARANEVTLDQRGHSVTFDSSGTFDKAMILPDEEIVRLGDSLGWEVILPSSEQRGATGVDPIPCTLVARRLVCS